MARVIVENAALLAANTRLRGERDRARDLAVRSGIFEGATPAAALDGDEQLTVVTLTQPCGCPVGEGHRCNPPF